MPVLTVATECSGALLDQCIALAHLRGLSPAALQYELIQCHNNYGCGRRFDCVADVNSPIADRTTCCPSPRPGQPAQVKCGGVCRDECSSPPPRYMDPRTCECRCIVVSCPPPLRQNPSTCVCDCAPCPVVGQLQDPQPGCACRCPPERPIPCQGICIDPQTDPIFCGGCPGDTCDPFTEKCCGGVCARLGTKQHCRDCFDAVNVAAGEDCCPFAGFFRPTQLGTNDHCSACHDKCTGGRQCITQPDGSKKCDCPAGSRICGANCCPQSRDCCNGVCCASTEKCCKGACVNTSTDSNHCGYCCNECPSGASCINSVCECPPIGTGPVRQIVCDRASGPRACVGAPLARGHCANNMTPDPNEPWQVAWRQANPGVGFYTCPTGGSLVCHPTLATITAQNGGPGCCPPGSTRVVNGKCL
jgi:hypothetical protein